MNPHFPVLRYRVVQVDFASGLVKRPDLLQGLDAGRRIGGDVSADLQARNGLFHPTGRAFLRRLQGIHVKIAVRFLGQVALRNRNESSRERVSRYSVTPRPRPRKCDERARR